MRRDDFTYGLPEELIAQAPLPERSGSRLLVLDRSTGEVSDRNMKQLPALLRAGDLLVFNDTRVVAARLIGAKPSGGRVEIFLERALEGPQALAQVSASKPIRPGLQIATPGGAVRVIERRDDLWVIETPGPALEFFEAWGQVPLPPYIHRTADADDRERYQSIFARDNGAVAAPTASLHFDRVLADEIAARGVSRTFVTLHVGAGTFQPIRTDDLESHTMHAERVSVGAEACEAMERARADGGRVIAIGTTVVRALESAALAVGKGRPWTGESRLFIRPGFQFQLVDALLTNFHLPESTLLMLVCALAGRERVLAAYQHAVQARYRFFSYGDAMFVTGGT